MPLNMFEDSVIVSQDIMLPCHHVKDRVRERWLGEKEVGQRRPTLARETQSMREVVGRDGSQDNVRSKHALPALVVRHPTHQQPMPTW